MGILSRSLAFRIVGMFLLGTLLGSLLPESGNVLVHLLGNSEIDIHAFNPCFLALGVAGIVLALRVGYRRGGDNT